MTWSFAAIYNLSNSLTNEGGLVSSGRDFVTRLRVSFNVTRSGRVFVLGVRCNLTHGSASRRKVGG